MLKNVIKHFAVGCSFCLLSSFVTQAAQANFSIDSQRFASMAVSSNACVQNQNQSNLCLFPSPTPTATPTPTPSPTAVPIKRTTGPKPPSLNPDVIFSMINQHRSEIGLPAYIKDDRLCSIATSRGPELNNEIFGGGTIHGGFYARNIPFWITENEVSQPTEQSAFDWWMHSAIHRKAIESPSFTYSCGDCWGNSCVELFTSWQPK
jgi:uncharacterized protein YkwD